MAIGFQNPFTFSSMAVTIVTALVYLGLAIPLIVLHETVPRSPSNPVLYSGVNTTEAWNDLKTLTNGYHPYNSRRNDEVRDWLLQRIASILDDNRVSWNSETKILAEPSSQKAHGVELNSARPSKLSLDELKKLRSSPASHAVTVFNDLHSNISFSSPGGIGAIGGGQLPGQSIYFEGTNVIVYIRGTEDDEGEWWQTYRLNPSHVHGKGGVLINAHYDSVSTGFGATDDGVGVVTVLQLIRFFTTPGNQPKKGVVALLNNGEEDFLNGARAYTQHPISDFAFTFLNLEGAGAGGRAVLFRSTDMEVTKSYAYSTHPFGTVVAADGFKAGLIRSQTDYVVFEDVLGLRGLDVAFWYPRSRYHTDQDDARHTSIDSLWHMLSAAMSTMSSLTSDTGSTFVGPRGDDSKRKVPNGKGSDGVWFDLFGKGFAIFALRGLFAWALTILVATPIILFVVIVVLIGQGKFYYFASSIPCSDGGIEAEPLSLQGWRGCFRFPIAFIVSSGLTIGSAYLIAKINPLIVYSSWYTVWAMMLCLCFTSFWFVSRLADAMRPSALHRGYSFLWMFVIGWILLVAVTVLADRFHIATGYLIVFFESAVFLGAFISLVDLFALPSKEEYAHSAHEHHNPPDYEEDQTPVIGGFAVDGGEEPEPDERTPLWGGDGNQSRGPTTFAHYARRSQPTGGEGSINNVPVKHNKHHTTEQGWSENLPAWTWIIQFILVAPIIIIIFGQVGLFIVGASSQTGPDGSPLSMPLILIAFFSIFLVMPLAPFAHRVNPKVPIFLFLIFTGTLIYSLAAFPFSPSNRYKAYFVQYVDLETGQNNVTIAGLEEFVRPIIATLPSTTNRKVECVERGNIRTGVKFCSWSGMAPKVVNQLPDGVPPEKGYAKWLDFNVTRTANQNEAQFSIRGTNTRACVIRFNNPIRSFNVHGSGSDERFDRVTEAGSNQIKLWHRNWDETWVVDVQWFVSDGKEPGEEGLDGTVVCLWSDANTQGVIPALDEIRRYAPDWVAVTKATDGLVEGSKRFVV